MSSQTTGTAANQPPAISDSLKHIGAAELAIFLQPLNTFLTALQQPGANIQTVVQDFANEKLQALQDLPQAESTGISMTAAAAQAQLNNLVAQVASPAVNSAQSAASDTGSGQSS